MDQNKFLEYVQAENKVEPKDLMPEDYRKLLVRQMSQHAHSEIVGMLPSAEESSTRVLEVVALVVAAAAGRRWWWCSSSWQKKP